jgi:hypothetical protein
VRTHHVSAYVEVLGRRYRAPTVKQHLAANRVLFDWLIVGQIFAGPNPAALDRFQPQPSRDEAGKACDIFATIQAPITTSSTPT